MLETILGFSLLVIAYFPIMDFLKKVENPVELISEKDIAWLGLSVLFIIISDGLFTYAIFV